MTKSGIFLSATMLLPLTMLPAQGASVSKTYKYFSIRGNTLEEIEKELSSRGPQLESTGKRHPGSTRMEFTLRVTYDQANGRCRIDDARASVRAEVTLPRWRPRAKADRDVRLIWETLASDIKRHEESHIIIAKNHARQLEDEIKTIGGRKSCAAIVTKVQAIQNTILKRHDGEQNRFDRIEVINFEKRINSLLQYRLERIQGAAKARAQVAKEKAKTGK